EVGWGWRSAAHRQHGGELAPVVGGVVRDVLEKGPQGEAELPARGVPVGHNAREVGDGEPLDKRALLAFEGVPALTEDPEAGDLVARKLRRARGRADPPLEPRPVGPVDVRQHAPESEKLNCLPTSRAATS